MTKHRIAAGLSRRQVLAAGAAGIVGIPLAAATSRRARADTMELPKLGEDDSAAKALAYVHDASNIDTAEFPSYQAGSNCANCQLYTGGPDGAWGPCSIFPGKLVSANGWCRTWVKKPA